MITNDVLAAQAAGDDEPWDGCPRLDFGASNIRNARCATLSSIYCAGASGEREARKACRDIGGCLDLRLLWRHRRTTTVRPFFLVFGSSIFLNPALFFLRSLIKVLWRICVARAHADELKIFENRTMRAAHQALHMVRLPSRVQVAPHARAALELPVQGLRGHHVATGTATEPVEEVAIVEVRLPDKVGSEDGEALNLVDALSPVRLKVLEHIMRGIANADYKDLAALITATSTLRQNDLIEDTLHMCSGIFVLRNLVRIGYFVARSNGRFALESIPALPGDCSLPTAVPEELARIGNDDAWFLIIGQLSLARLESCLYELDGAAFVDAVLVYDATGEETEILL